jgi:hypothetical protein
LFVGSLGRVGYRGAVCLFLKDVDETTQATLRGCGVQTVAVGPQFPPAGASIIAFRYWLYQWFLGDYGDRFDQVMLSDTRDVFFQRDPFDFPLGEALCCFREDSSRTIGTCPFNSQWIREAFGNSALEELRDHPILCAGTTMGSTSIVKKYVDAMVDQLGKLRRLAGGVDQGVHNYLIQTGRFAPVAYFDNAGGPIMTLGYKSAASLRRDDQHRVLTDSGDLAHTLHQFDRHPELEQHLQRSLRNEHPGSLADPSV